MSATTTETAAMEKYLYTQSRSFMAPIKLRLVVSYAGSIIRGNPFLCLPRDVRNDIYSFALSPSDTTCEPPANIDIPDTGNIVFPDPCDVDPVFNREITELLFGRVGDSTSAFRPSQYEARSTYRTSTYLVITSNRSKATITIPSDVAAYNFLVWLGTNARATSVALSHGLVKSIEFLSLEIMEKGMFTSNATKLMRSLPMLETVALMVDLRSLLFMEGKNGGKAVDVRAMAAKYDLEGLVQVPCLKTVVLTLKPYMALGKMLKELGNDGTDGFWGLQDWIQGRIAMRGRGVNVICRGV
ncbi:unnamed protein product [Periconia digitata]|uniref:Uncharacterized protein n=1 Tax=Periconia digitata TaxID=1303443 RepID=A0A9W4XDY6_9PLEO|nr:unnamed protein product [Periconia digitata]